MINALVENIKACLSPDLLKPPFKPVKDNPTAGHCYAASEALYHLLGGVRSGFFPVRGRDDMGIVHWWLENKMGEIVDPTRDQYLSQQKTPPYSAGRRGGFLTKNPSRRAGILMERVRGRL